ncbi:MAG: TIGR02757 family protein [Brumimicrobium sp.]|nr:TIGR02757 family protein [Brumimicrobium sp.]
MKFNEIHELLELKVEEFNAHKFVATDPIQIPHGFEKKQDIEISGLLVSLIAWGNRTMIIRNGEKLMKLMDYRPHRFVRDYEPGSIQERDFVHRTFNGTDLDFIVRGLQNIYSVHDSLENAFDPHPNFPGVKGRIIQFREKMNRVSHEKRSEKHISNPEKNSAAKRINMYMRWMVRQDKQGVDFGIWNSIKPSELYIPLDIHTGNVARKLGLLKRKQNDWQALEELMVALRKMDPHDPVKYDFALFGLGAFDKF